MTSVISPITTSSSDYSSVETSSTLSAHSFFPTFKTTKDKMELKLKALKLLGDSTAQDLWPFNNVVLLTWCLLIFVPYWKLTPKLTLIAPLLLSVLYAGTTLSLVLWPDPEDPEVDFGSLEGV